MENNVIKMGRREKDDKDEKRGRGG